MAGNALTVWRPARNSIHCSDALRFLWQLPSESVDLIVTDPPYGIGDVVSAWRSPHKRFADVANNDKVHTAWLNDAYRVLVPGGAGYIFASWRNFHEWIKALQGVGFRVRDCIVWDKLVHGLSGLTTHYAPQHEFILYVVKDYHYINWPRPKNIIRVMRVEPTKLVHPYEKPISLLQELIRVSSQRGDLVFDPFVGSGSTAVAALGMGRDYIGCDLSQEYVDLANRRLQTSDPMRDTVLPGGSKQLSLFAGEVA